MKYINIGFSFTDDLALKHITINHNDTELDSDSELVKKVIMTALKSFHLNKDDVSFQDLLNKNDIKIQNPTP